MAGITLFLRGKEQGAGIGAEFAGGSFSLGRWVRVGLSEKILIQNSKDAQEVVVWMNQAEKTSCEKTQMKSLVS